MKFFTLLAILTFLSFAETKNCGCSEASHSRAAELVGEKKLNFTVIGMSCESCEKGLTEKLKKEEGIISVDKVNHQEKLVMVTVKPEVCETVIKQAITKAGYFVKDETKK